MSHERPTPTTPADSTDQPTNLIDDYALDRIEFRVGRLTRLFRLNDADADDLRQELALELVKAADRFDPALATRRTFVNGALDRCYRHICRRFRARQRHSAMSPAPVSMTENFLFRLPKSSSMVTTYTPPLARSLMKRRVHYRWMRFSQP